MEIKDIFKEYRNQLDLLDLDFLTAHAIGKSREFILTHPEYKIPSLKIKNLKLKISRRMQSEPIAHILGEKEFYGLPFKVTKDTLIPRPETEMIVENILKLNPKNKTIIDVGSGSGNIIISLAKNLKTKNIFYGIDISAKALSVAKQNSKLNKVEKEIKFLKGSLLQPLIKKDLNDSIIIANLPYLSKKIYDNTMPDVKNFEPKSALYSAKEGLNHYKKLFSQIKKMRIKTTIFIEFSPEQKKSLGILAKKYFPKAKSTFQKDLAGKWRILEIYI